MELEWEDKWIKILVFKIDMWKFSEYRSSEILFCLYNPT